MRFNYPHSDTYCPRPSPWRRARGRVYECKCGRVWRMHYEYQWKYRLISEPRDQW